MFIVLGFYKFKKLKSLKKNKLILHKLFIDNKIKGILIISDEGLNGTISGKYKDIFLISKKIKTIVKPALETLEEFISDNLIFDIIFIDADKNNYKNYYDKVIQMTKQGGLIIIDNVLWHGEVADEENNEKFTNIIRDFNTYVKKDKRTEQIILPLGDGLTICNKL